MLGALPPNFCVGGAEIEFVRPFVPRAKLRKESVTFSSIIGIIRCSRRLPAFALAGFGSASQRP
jgi:hypothetical protein